MDNSTKICDGLAGKTKFEIHQFTGFTGRTELVITIQGKACGGVTIDEKPRLKTITATPISFGKISFKASEETAPVAQTSVTLDDIRK